jgi:hypothetical protein
MTNLRTFSLRVDPEPRRTPFCGCHSSTFGHNFVQNILRELPPKCIYLEIDIGGASVGCACDELRGLMPHLHHLRIGLPSLYLRFLSASRYSVAFASGDQKIESQLMSSSLRSLAIPSVIYPRSKTQVQGCSSVEIASRWLAIVKGARIRA